MNRVFHSRAECSPRARVLVPRVPRPQCHPFAGSHTGACTAAPAVVRPWSGTCCDGWRVDAGSATTESTADTNPLRLRSALEMTVLFQVAITTMAFVRSSFGALGLYAMAALLGLTDVDALTVSMSSPSGTIAAATAARALAVGILANTLLKTSVVLVVGRAEFRSRAGLACSQWLP